MKDWPKAEQMAWLKVNDDLFFGVLVDGVLTNAVQTAQMDDWIAEHNIGSDTSAIKVGGGAVLSKLSGTERLDFENSLGVMAEAKKYTSAYAENEIFRTLLRD